MTLCTAAVLGAIALWVVPVTLTQRASEDLEPIERLDAINDIRAPTVAFLIACGAAGTLFYTARAFSLNREGHVTDRYTKAIGQLGDKNIDVRVGGLFALHRIGMDSPRDRDTIIQVLGAFIRRASRGKPEQQGKLNEDVQVALKVAVGLLKESDVRLDLRTADLADLAEADRSALVTEKVLLPPPAA